MLVLLNKNVKALRNLLFEKMLNIALSQHWNSQWCSNCLVSFIKQILSGCWYCNEFYSIALSTSINILTFSHTAGPEDCFFFFFTILQSCLFQTSVGLRLQSGVVKTSLLWVTSVSLGYCDEWGVTIPLHLCYSANVMHLPSYWTLPIESAVFQNYYYLCLSQLDWCILLKNKMIRWPEDTEQLEWMNRRPHLCKSLWISKYTALKCAQISTSIEFSIKRDFQSDSVLLTKSVFLFSFVEHVESRLALTT